MSRKTKFLCFVIVFEVFCIASCSYDKGFLTSKVFDSQWFPSEELKISHIEAKYTGAGFTKAPKIIIEGGGGTGAQAIAEIDELGSVSRVTMQNHGSGYTSEPKVRFDGDGDGLVLIPKMSPPKGIHNIVVNIGGIGYIKPPQVMIGGQSKKPAYALAKVSERKIQFVDVLYAGEGYTGKADVKIIQDGATSAKGNAMVNNGKILKITISDAGSNFTQGTTISVTKGGGTGAVLKPSFKNDSIDKITVINSGNGYATTPKIALLGPGSGVRIDAKMRADEPGTRIPLKISTYGIMLAISFLFANFLLQKEFTRLNISTKLADNIIIAAVIGGIAGSKIFYAWEAGEPISFSIMFSGGGLTWYGGFIVAGSIIAFLIIREGLKFSKLADIITPALAAGYGFGRLGCLFSGDGCFGQVCPTNLIFPLGMAYPDGAVQSFAKVYNTPFYESAFSFLMFAFFWKIREKEWPNGFKFSIFLILHSLFRYLVEFIRRNPRDVFGMTQAQFIAICAIGAAALFFLYRHKDVETLFKRGEKSIP